MKKTTKKTREVKKPTLEFQSNLEVSGKKFGTEGATLLESFNFLVPKMIVKGKSILTVNRGERKHAVVLNPFLVRRFIMNPVYRQILAKRLSIFL